MALVDGEVSRQERQELGRAIVEQAERLTDLVDKLLDLSRLQAGAAEPRPQWCSVDEILRDAVPTLDPDGSRFALSIDPDLPLIRGDAAQLGRAFANLLENAARYSGDQRVSVDARVVGERLIVRVNDRRPGDLPQGAQADLRRVLQCARQAPQPHRLRAGARDRQGLRRGQRRRGVGGVAARPGRKLRRRAPARARAGSGGVSDVSRPGCTRLAG